MGLVFKSFFAEGISQLSYLVGDDSEGTAAIIDPRPDVDGYRVGGMKMWQNAGLPLKKLPQMPVQELKEDRGTQRLDVRSPGEWQKGHIPGATHHFVGKLRDQMPDLDRNQPVATYCASGYRASLAASLLQRAGFEKVHNVPGSWKAWTSAGYPVDSGG
jgi:hydroxyacylglutathione hydrolase